MLALTRARSPTKVTERAGLYESLGSTSKTDASSKKRAGSQEESSDASTRTERALKRTMKSTTSGPFQLRAAWGSPWEQFEKVYGIELGGPRGSGYSEGSSR